MRLTDRIHLVGSGEPGVGADRSARFPGLPGDHRRRPRRRRHRDRPERRGDPRRVSPRRARPARDRLDPAHPRPRRSRRRRRGLATGSARGPDRDCRRDARRGWPPATRRRPASTAPGRPGLYPTDYRLEPFEVDRTARAGRDADGSPTSTFRAIPSPGHAAGHLAFLVDARRGRHPVLRRRAVPRPAGSSSRTPGTATSRRPCGASSGWPASGPIDCWPATSSRSSARRDRTSPRRSTGSPGCSVPASIA